MSWLIIAVAMASLSIGVGIFVGISVNWFASLPIITFGLFMSYLMFTNYKTEQKEAKQ